MPISVSIPCTWLPTDSPPFSVGSNRVSATYFLQLSWYGLDEIYRRVRAAEEETQQEKLRVCFQGMMSEEERESLSSSDFESYCSLHNDPVSLVAINACIHYSVQASAFFRTFEHAYGLRDKPFAQMFPGLTKFRNKVAAHPALSEPGRENDVTRAVSITPLVALKNGRFVINDFVVTETGETGRESSPSDWSWCLTKVHEQLRSAVKDLLPVKVP